MYGWDIESTSPWLRTQIVYYSIIQKIEDVVWAYHVLKLKRVYLRYGFQNIAANKLVGLSMVDLDKVKAALLAVNPEDVLALFDNLFPEEVKGDKLP